MNKPRVCKKQGFWRVEWIFKKPYTYVVLDIGKNSEDWSRAMKIAIDSYGRDPFGTAMYHYLMKSLSKNV